MALHAFCSAPFTINSTKAIINNKYHYMKTIIKSIFTCASLVIFMACSGGGDHGHDHEGTHEHEHEHSEAHEHSEHEHEHSVDEHSEGEHEHEHSEGGASAEITLSPQQAKQFGVKSVVVKRGPFHETLKVSGQIIGAQGDEYTVVASSAGVVSLNKSVAVGSHVSAGQAIARLSAKNMVGGDANEQARIIYNNAKRELERLKPLYEDKIVTARDYNNALENYERARAACASRSGGGVATTAIAGTVIALNVADGEFVEAGAPIAKVSKNARLLLRADVPASYATKVQNFSSANFRTSAGSEVYSVSKLGGRRLSAGTTAAAQPGYIPVCFEFTNNGTLVSGSFAEIYLIGTERSNAIAVPTTALTEELGSFFVYVQLDDECYAKRRVETGISDGCNIEILSGLNEGEKVVAQGATIIKLAGSGGAIPGHSHEH